jgi:hypothetical protein
MPLAILICMRGFAENQVYALEHLCSVMDIIPRRPQQIIHKIALLIGVIKTLSEFRILSLLLFMH